MIKYPSTGKFRDVVKTVRKSTPRDTKYIGQDENDKPILEHTQVLPTYKVIGFEKIHGCLRKGTLIDVKGLGLLPIEKVIPGMEVSGVNHTTKKPVWSKVKNTKKEEDLSKQWYDLSTEDSTITVTGNHQIYIENEDKYIDVETLFKELEVKNFTTLSSF